MSRSAVRARHWTKYILAAAVMAAAGYFLLQNISVWAQEVRASGSSIDYSLLAVSVGVNMICSMLGGWEWTILLRSLGNRLAVRPGIKIQMTANLAKYIPGYAWQLLGKVYLSEQNGIPRPAAIVSIAAELATIVGTGVLLSLVALPASRFLHVQALDRTVLQLIAFVVVVLVLWLHPVPLRWLIGRFRLDRRFPPLAQVDWETWRRAVVAIFLTWLLLGVGFCATIASVWPLQLVHVPTCLATLAISFVLSLLAVFVPNGLGVRELTMSVLLSQIMPTPTAAAVAILARLALVAGELLGFLAISLAPTRRHEFSRGPGE